MKKSVCFALDFWSPGIMRCTYQFSVTVKIKTNFYDNKTYLPPLFYYLFAVLMRPDSFVSAVVPTLGSIISFFTITSQHPRLCYPRFEKFFKCSSRLFLCLRKIQIFVTLLSVSRLLDFISFPTFSRCVPVFQYIK